MGRLYIIRRIHTAEELSEDTDRILYESVQSIEDAEIISAVEDNFARIFNGILADNDSGYLMTVDDSDRFTSDYIKSLIQTLEKSEAAYVSGQKSFIWNGKQVINKLQTEKTQSELISYTDILPGTLIDISKAKDFSLKEQLPYEMEADFLLRLALRCPAKVNKSLRYDYCRPDASQFQCYQGEYFREWYYDSINNFLIPLLNDAGGG